jgi:uncharacterized protein YbjT (DUF2867 family)
VIAIVGGSGRLGTRLVTRLVARGESVRVLSREPGRAQAALPQGVEAVRADVTDPPTLGVALAGATTVVSAITGFGGPGALGAAAVDGAGNEALIMAAERAGAARFVLLSVVGASAASPVRLFRAKAAAEARLAASSLAWSVVRPTAYLELWLDMVGRPLVATGRTRVFGRGDNPINFVAVDDVAAVVERLATGDAPPPGTIVTVAGPRDLTMNELAALVAAAADVPARVDHVPPAVLRLLATALGPIRPVLADQVRAALLMDTATPRLGPEERTPAIADLPRTSPEAVIRAIFPAPAGEVAATGG